MSEIARVQSGDKIVYPGYFLLRCQHCDYKKIFFTRLSVGEMESLCKRTVCPWCGKKKLKWSIGE